MQTVRLKYIFFTLCINAIASCRVSMHLANKRPTHNTEEMAEVCSDTRLTAEGIMHTLQCTNEHIVMDMSVCMQDKFGCHSHCDAVLCVQQHKRPLPYAPTLTSQRPRAVQEAAQFCHTKLRPNRCQCSLVKCYMCISVVFRENSEIRGFWAVFEKFSRGSSSNKQSMCVFRPCCLVLVSFRGVMTSKRGCEGNESF